MRVSVETTGALGRRLEVSVPAERVEAEFHARLKDFSRKARLKGFRPGKAPIKVVERQFGSQLREEVVGELVRASLAEALAQNQLAPADGPRIERLSAANGQDLSFSATFEVYPQVELRQVEGFELVKPQAEVGSADVDAMIETLRRQRATFVAVTRPAALNDRVTVDFDGRLAGEPFEGGQGEKVPVVLGAGRMVKDFEAGLVGAVAGEERSFPVVFPDDFAEARLAGQTVAFTVQVREVAEQVLPELDESFCRDFGVAEGGTAQLRREVEENMQRELAGNVRARLRSVVLDALVAANPVDLPASAVDAQLRELQVEWLRRSGVAAKDLKAAPPREPFEPSARKAVALRLLLSELIRREQLVVEEARVEERITQTAAGYPDPDAAAREIRERRDVLQQLRSLALEDQVVDWLIARAKITEQPSTFKEIMNFGA
jgi:trigger factor